MTSGGAALAQLRSSPSAEGAQRVYMIKEESCKLQTSSIKKIQPVVEKKIQPEVASFKRQASSSKQRLTMVTG